MFEWNWLLVGIGYAKAEDGEMMKVLKVLKAVRRGEKREVGGDDGRS